jgi:4-hydroxy-tetrahydrodipicolinate reductase
MIEKKIRMVQFGCGPIGCRVVQFAHDRSNLQIVGAVDIAEDIVGRDLGEVAGAEPLGVPIEKDAPGLFKRTNPDMVVHTTGSRLPDVFGQLKLIVQSGINVVSTCEELSFPFVTYPEMARELDTLAKEHDVTILGTGVNPGFLMDAWPLFMTGVLHKVDSLLIRRIQDASVRRLPFQEKIGAGLSREEFQKRVSSGTFGHVGLRESIYMISSALDWEVEKIEENIAPVILDREVKGPHVTVPRGKVVGLKQSATCYVAGQAAIILDFQAYLGAPQSFDSISIKGTPDLEVKIEGGTHGDTATASIVLNALPRVIQAVPGLLSMKDIPPLVCRC